MKTALGFLSLMLLALPGRAPAQVDVQIHLGLPVAPPLVVVQPGIQVVENWDDEVFVHGGWYWVRRGPVWYRARGPQARFVVVEPRYVPAPLVRLPPGQYRHYRAAERREAHEHEKQARKHRKHQEKAERKAQKEWEKEERHGEHGRHR